MAGFILRARSMWGEEAGREVGVGERRALAGPCTGGRDQVLGAARLADAAVCIIDLTLARPGEKLLLSAGPGADGVQVSAAQGQCVFQFNPP